VSIFARTRSGVVRAGRARTLLGGGTAVVAAAVLIAPAAANAAAPSPAKPAGHIGGIVPVHGQAKANHLRTSSSDMSYHGGPVMTTNTVYAIYWAPSDDSGVTFSDTNYQTIVNQFLDDVATAQDATGNVYGIDTQYYNASGTHIANESKFGGGYLDSTPAGSYTSCSDTYTPGKCVTDSQIQAEVKAFMSAHGISASPTTLFAVFTAPGIGSCDSSSSCAFSQYCAYHGDFSSGGQTVYYANMPYVGTDLNNCGTGQSPNGDANADSEINVLSHETNEAITDEQLNAWYDKRGYEIGDKCAWNFGTALGGSSQKGTEYNQVINTHDYYVQQEWSNKVSACALKA
jgi:hypothetical protein